MSRQRLTGAAGKVSLRVGQQFNPFKLFTGIFIPEALVRAKGISLGAKMTYGRLARYAGHDGNCYPAVSTLAGELAISERQTQRYLAELDGNDLIRRIPRILECGQTSSMCVFLWHPLFEAGMTDPTPKGVTNPTPEAVTDWAPKESQTEESHAEETNSDLDSPPTNRKPRDSRVDVGDAAPSCKQYPRLREALADYMTTADDHERVYPPDRLAVDVMDAAAGAGEEEVIQCLQYLKNERGLRPGARNAPRHFSWFKTVVADYFHTKTIRETVFAPVSANGAGEAASLSEEDFDRMTEAIEIDGGSR